MLKEKNYGTYTREKSHKKFLKKCGIVDTAECHQCNIPTHKQARRQETDRHVMCYCTNQRAQKGRVLTTTLIKQELVKHIDPYSSKLLEWIYGNNSNTGRTNDFKINKERLQHGKIATTKTQREPYTKYNRDW